MEIIKGNQGIFLEVREIWFGCFVGLLTGFSEIQFRAILKEDNKMPKTIEELQSTMVAQLKRRGFYPQDEKEALLRLGEELGELFEAVREKWPKSKLSLEVVDIFWNLLRFCDLKNIDLEKSFIRKWKINERRPLPKNGFKKFKKMNIPC